MMSSEKMEEAKKALSQLKTPEERELALKILRQYSEEGESELFDALRYSDFDEIPVDIETFMHNPLYLGKALTDQEGRFTVFPY